MLQVASPRRYVWLLLTSGCFYDVADIQRGSSGGAGPVEPRPAQTLATAEAPWDLTQDEEDLYFTAADGVYRCAKSGEAAWFRKVTDGAQLFDLVVDDAWVYFADGQNARIAKVEKSGGLAQSVVSVDKPFALASDGTQLFYSAAGSAVFSVQKDGSGVRELYRGPDADPQSIYEIVTTDVEVVFGHSEGRGIFAVPGDRHSEPRQLAGITGQTYGLFALEGLVYFREGIGADGVLASVDLLGGARQDLLTGELGPSGVAAADGLVFFGNDVASASMLREYDVDRASVRSLATVLASVHALVVDASGIYWTDPSAGRVLRLER